MTVAIDFTRQWAGQKLDMNGVIGLSATDQGVSSENLLADFRRVNGAWALLRNSSVATQQALIDERRTGHPQVTRR